MPTSSVACNARTNDCRLHEDAHRRARVTVDVVSVNALLADIEDVVATHIGTVQLFLAGLLIELGAKP